MKNKIKNALLDDIPYPVLNIQVEDEVKDEPKVKPKDGLTTVEDKLAKAVPGYANVRDSVIKKNLSGVDILENTQARVNENTQARLRENGEISPNAPAPYGQRITGEGREIEVILLSAQKSPLIM